MTTNRNCPDGANPDRQDCDEEYTLPTAEALMAGTLALLTGYAQSAPGSAHRHPMAAKLVSNLWALAQHPDLSDPMRAMLCNLRIRWQLELERMASPCAAAPPTAQWHVAPAGIQ
ncbi:MAG: hypothetical protein ACK40L_03320 [Hydrogenophaga sp.]